MYFNFNLPEIAQNLGELHHGLELVDVAGFLLLRLPEDLDGAAAAQPGLEKQEVDRRGKTGREKVFRRNVKIKCKANRPILNQRRSFKQVYMLRKKRAHVPTSLTCARMQTGKECTFTNLEEFLVQ